MNQVSDKPLWTVRDIGHFLGVGRANVGAVMEQRGIRPVYTKNSGRGTCHFYAKADVLNAFATSKSNTNITMPFVAAQPETLKEKIGYCWLEPEDALKLRAIIKRERTTLGDWITSVVLEKLNTIEQ
jgi:hypothetical protein